MGLKIIKKLRILIVGEASTATHVLTTNEQGDVIKVPFNGGSGSVENLEGGFANAVYLSSQNTDGGGASSGTNGLINGGSALNV